MRESSKKKGNHVWLLIIGAGMLLLGCYFVSEYLVLGDEQLVEGTVVDTVRRDGNYAPVVEYTHPDTGRSNEVTSRASSSIKPDLGDTRDVVIDGDGDAQVRVGLIWPAVMFLFGFLMTGIGVYEMRSEKFPTQRKPSNLGPQDKPRSKPQDGEPVAEQVPVQSDTTRFYSSSMQLVVGLFLIALGFVIGGFLLASGSVLGAMFLLPFGLAGLTLVGYVDVAPEGVTIFRIGKIKRIPAHEIVAVDLVERISKSNERTDRFWSPELRLASGSKQQLHLLETQNAERVEHQIRTLVETLGVTSLASDQEPLGPLLASRRK